MHGVSNRATPRDVRRGNQRAPGPGEPVNLASGRIGRPAPTTLVHVLLASERLWISCCGREMSTRLFAARTKSWW